MVLEVIMESIFAIVDIYFLAKVGIDAVATVGLTESIMTILYAIAVGLSMSTTAIVARRIGEKNSEGAANSAFQAILTGLGISLIIAIPGAFFSKELLSLMGASNKIIMTYSGYMTVMMSGNAVIMMLFIINAIFRSAGDAAISMRVLWLANIFNIILDPCLIFGWGPFPELGVTGAAIATNIGRAIGVIYQLYILFSGKSIVKLKLSNLKPDFKLILNLLKLSVGAIGQHLIATSSWIGLMRIVSDFGSAFIAGYTIAIRIILFTIWPSWGISNAAATLVGQNLGAGKPERAIESVWFTGKINFTFMGIVGAILFFTAEYWVSLFTTVINVVEIGGEAIRILSLGYLAFGLGMVMLQSFNGAGDTTTPTIINFICYWIIEIPLAYLLAHLLRMEGKGVYYSILIAEIMMTVISIVIFSKGKWKQKRV
jgi:putative MATE family efflux protein